MIINVGVLSFRCGGIMLPVKTRGNKDAKMAKLCNTRKCQIDKRMFPTYDGYDKQTGKNFAHPRLKEGST
jgi:hypothetical protein